MRVPMTVALAISGLAGVFLMGGCGADAICVSEQYPVASVGIAGGQDCVDKGKQPPSGYVAYPKGKAPRHVGDEWDLYWADHALDAQGREVAAAGQ